MLVVSMVFNTCPIFIAVFGFFFLKERITKYEMGGLGLAFIGVIVLLVGEDMNGIQSELTYGDGMGDFD